MPPEILKVYLRIAEANSQSNLWISKKAFYFLCMFFTECVKPKSTWALLKPHVLQLTQSFLFPRLCFSEEDDEMWELDAVDFVRANLDPFEEIGSVAGSAATFIQTVASKRTKSAFMPLLEFVTEVVNAYPAQRSAKDKDGAFHLCRAMDLTMVNHEKVSHMLDGFFAQHVIPELKSEHKFLRYRACDLVKAFDQNGMQWSNTATLEAAFRGVMECIGDAELPVRVVAAEAIGSLIDHDEVHAAMAPNAARLMQELLKLSDETDLDILSPTKSKVVANFGDELLPFRFSSPSRWPNRTCASSTRTSRPQSAMPTAPWSSTWTTTRTTSSSPPWAASHHLPDHRLGREQARDLGEARGGGAAHCGVHDREGLRRAV